MTNPDLKNGRGGLRDIQLLRAMALGNLCDFPDLDVEQRLLTKLHKDDGLAADVGIDLIAGLEFLTGCDSIRKTDVDINR